MTVGDNSYLLPPTENPATCSTTSRAPAAWYDSADRLNVIRQSEFSGRWRCMTVPASRSNRDGDPHAKLTPEELTFILSGRVPSEVEQTK
jgi:hypothetical protein